MQRLTHPQSQHLEDPVQSLSCEHVCSVISAGHLVGSETYGHTPGRTIKSARLNLSKCDQWPYFLKHVLGGGVPFGFTYCFSFAFVTDHWGSILRHFMHILRIPYAPSSLPLFHWFRFHSRGDSRLRDYCGFLPAVPGVFYTLPH